MRLTPSSVGLRIGVVMVVTTVSLYFIYRLLKDSFTAGFKYIIQKTWDGKPVHHENIEISLQRIENVIELHVKAPFMNDPPAPVGERGKPFPQLWDYEVVEVFFLNDKDEYLEVELCPHGQHLVLMLKGRRNIVKDLLPLEFSSEIKSASWYGRVRIPLEYFPPAVTKFNAYAIHGSEGARIYEALYTVPGTEPDFHRLEYFGVIEFDKLVPENYSSSYRSPFWQ